MSKYRIICLKQKSFTNKFAIQKRVWFSWKFLDFDGFPVPENCVCSYPNYELAKNALNDFIENHGKFKIIQEFKVNDINSQIDKIKIIDSLV